MKSLFRKNRMIEMDSVTFADTIGNLESSTLLYSDITVKTFQTQGNSFAPSNRYALESFTLNGNKVDVFVIFHNRAILFIEKSKKFYKHTVYTTTKKEGLYLDEALKLVANYKIS